MALVAGFYMLEILSVTFKNAVILGFIAIAFQKIKPVPKTA
jgi:hypothetical protein